MPKQVDIFSTEKAVQNCLPLLYEMLQRLNMVTAMLENKLNLPTPYVREFSYLQFRYVCELLALCCLHMHGDLPVASMNRTRKNWNAESIMNTLIKDYPHAFPQSFHLDRSKKPMVMNMGTKENALTLNEFKKLYNQCGDVLHKGKILKAKPVFMQGDLSMEDVREWQKKVIALLNAFAITRSGSQGIYVIRMKAENGLPECDIIKIVDGDKMEIHTCKINLINNKKPSQSS